MRLTRRRAIQCVAALLAAAGLWVAAPFGSQAEDAAQPSDRSSRSMSTSRITGGRQSKQAALEAKLEQILAHQRTILQKSEQVKEEVRIVQVRATSRAAVQP